MADGWFRFYNTALEHPKVLPLSDAQFRAWLVLLSMASKIGGIIPEDFSLIAMTLRKTMAKSRDLVQGLLSAGLIDRVPGGFAPHNWTAKQFKSDEGSAERMRRHRQRKNNVTSDGGGDVTFRRNSDTPETETETETEKKKDAATAAPVPAIVYPPWLPLEAWQAFLEMRKKKRAAPTDAAIVLLLKKLERWRLLGHDPTEILNYSTMGNYTGLFEPKGAGNGQGNSQKRTSTDQHLAGIASLASELRARRAG